jgi:hypothetical protein
MMADDRVGQKKTKKIMEVVRFLAHRYLAGANHWVMRAEWLCDVNDRMGMREPSPQYGSAKQD